MRTIRKQNGFALLIFVVVLLGIAGVIGSNLIQSKTKTVYIEKIEHDQVVLRKAKLALLSYVMEYKKTDQMDEMGRLPCPDIRFEAPPSGTSEGAQDTPCGDKHVNSVGFFPWKTLGIEVLSDSSGECLWYVVSGEYKDDPKAGMLNEDSNGLIKVQDENGQPYHGTAAGDRPIALIIAPGPVLDGQNRSPANSSMKYCRGNYTEGNYIESDGSIDYSTDHAETADKIWTYIYGSAIGGLENRGYNDRMVWITKSEYWAAIKAQGDLDAIDINKDINKLTKKLASCLAAYGSDTENNNHWLPWPAKVDLDDYRDHDNYSDQDFSATPSPRDLMGRFPYDITKTNDHETSPQSTAMSNFISSCLLPDELALWENWKDHFFYVVSEGFEMVHGDTHSTLKDRCDSDKCVKIEDGSADNVAAIVFYSDSVIGDQIRDYDPVDDDEKDKILNYLETDPANADKSNAHQYPVDTTFSGNSRKFYRGLGDITYCVEVDSTSFSVTDCNP